MNLGILGFPLFKRTHLPLFFCNGKTSVVGTSLLGLGTSARYPQETQEIAGVSPLRGQDAYFKDFTKAWIKLQENGVPELRDAL